jgi:hypothetical protein
MAQEVWFNYIKVQMRVVAETQVMELKKSIATLEFVKSVMNSIFVNKFLLSLLNFAFIRLFLYFFDSLHSCSNFHQTCLFLRLSLGVNKLNFGLLTFFE